MQVCKIQSRELHNQSNEYDNKLDRKFCQSFGQVNPFKESTDLGFQGSFCGQSYLKPHTFIYEKSNSNLLRKMPTENIEKPIP